MSPEAGEFGEVRHAHRQVPVQNEVAAVVVLHDAGLDLLAAHVGRRVDVGDESDHGGRFAPRRGGDRSHYVTVPVHRHLGHAEGLHLVA